MSLAASTVETWPRRGPALVLQAVAKDCAVLAKLFSSSGVSGVGSAPRNWSSWRSSTQLIGVGPADAAGVEPDNVVALAHGFAHDEVCCTGVVHARAAGAARVDDQGPDPALLPGGRHPQHLDGDGVAVRLVVAQGHGEVCALTALALGPAQVLPVVASESLRAAGRCLRRLRRGRPRIGLDARAAPDQRAAGEPKRQCQRGRRQWPSRQSHAATVSRLAAGMPADSAFGTRTQRRSGGRCGSVRVSREGAGTGPWPRARAAG